MLTWGYVVRYRLLLILALPNMDVTLSPKIPQDLQAQGNIDIRSGRIDKYRILRTSTRRGSRLRTRDPPVVNHRPQVVYLGTEAKGS